MAKDRTSPSGTGPFDILKMLKARPADLPASHRTRKKAIVAGRPAAHPEIDFRAEMRGVHALPAPNRAEIQRPKPEPLPRPKSAEPLEEPSGSPIREPESFAEAMRGVVRLTSDGRVDPALLLVGKHRTTLPPKAAETPDMGAWLDAAPEPNNPSALFRHAIGPTSALKNTGRVELERPAPSPQPLQRAADDREVLRESVEAPLSFQDRLEMGDEAAFLRSGLPRRVLTDLRRGRWIVQAELDLHGLTRDDARSELGRFLATRLTRGERCVRVIHGKGHGSPGRIAVLKQLSRNWLAQREEILAFCQARPHDGGDGAVLVLLRAPRSA